MAVINSVVTEDARRYWPQYLGGLFGPNISRTAYLPTGNPTVLSDVALLTGDVVQVLQTESGTIATSGTAVTGTTTTFLTSLYPGDWIVAGGQTQVVASVTSNTVLTTVAPFYPALSGGTTYQSQALYRIVTVHENTVSSPTRTPITIPDLKYVERIYTGHVFGLDIGTPVYRVRDYNVMPKISSFKIGEGGWVDFGGGAIPRVPDATLRRLDNNLQDIDAIVDDTRTGSAERYALTSRAIFEKQLVAGDFQFLAPSTLRVNCTVLTTEFNDDGFGGSPEVWEIGLFAEHPTVPGEKLMVAYGTFPKQTKTNAVQLTNQVDITF